MNALQNPSTLKPEISELAIRIIIAFITNKNKPNKIANATNFKRGRLKPI